MSILSQSMGGPPPPPVPVRQFTVDEYHRMIETGILDEDENVELLEGWVVPKMSRGPAHDTVVSLADEKIGSILPAEWITRLQSGVTTTDSEPEPDLAVVRGPGGVTSITIPVRRRWSMAVEVAKSSLHRDRTLKGTNLCSGRCSSVLDHQSC